MRCKGNEQCQPLSIHTRKITDSCRDKDCIEDLRVYLTRDSQAALDNAAGAKVRSAELLHAHIDVQPIAFHRNHYCIDVTFYYRILADAVLGTCRPATLCGLAVFSKRAVLCGENSPAHIFTSDMCPGDGDGLPHYGANLPTAVVEVLDPMVLASKVRDVCECHTEILCPQIPRCVQCAYDDDLVQCGEHKRLFVTLGQFSIIRLERDAQLIVQVLGNSIPTKECCEEAGCAEDPCEMFSRIPFPAKQFAPTDCPGDHAIPNRCK
jgi:hypothetical protein